MNTPTTAPAEQAELPAVVAFLLGEAPLEGVWFGEKPPGAAPFWWREQLRRLHAVEASRAVRAEPSDLTQALRHALEVIAVGDSLNPQADAAEELIALGIWRDIPEARVPVGRAVRAEPALTFAQWKAGLTTEALYDFDSEGRGFKKDAGRLMRMAWDAAIATHQPQAAESAAKSQRDDIEAICAALAERDALIERLRLALERTSENYRRTLSSKPVRDVQETLAEADGALATYHQQRKEGGK